MYQNQHLHALRGICPFAWNVFPRLQAFLRPTRNRWRCVRSADGTPVTVRCESGDCEQLCQGQGHLDNASRIKLDSSRQLAGTEETTGLLTMSTHRAWRLAMVWGRFRMVAQSKTAEYTKVAQHNVYHGQVDDDLFDPSDIKTSESQQSPDRLAT